MTATAVPRCGEELVAQDDDLQQAHAQTLDDGCRDLPGRGFLGFGRDPSD
jgi:hypothetical protein